METLGINPALLVAFGLLVGVFSGVMGLGGGSIMIPILVLLLSIPQAKAHGLSLAVMIPPVTLPAVYRYWQEGKLTRVDFVLALWIALGFAIGSYGGGWLANFIDRQGATALKLVFGFMLIYVAGYTVFGTQHLARTLGLSLALVAIAVGMFWYCRWQDRVGA